MVGQHGVFLLHSGSVPAIKIGEICKAMSLYNVYRKTTSCTNVNYVHWKHIAERTVECLVKEVLVHYSALNLLMIHVRWDVHTLVR